MQPITGNCVSYPQPRQLSNKPELSRQKRREGLTQCTSILQIYPCIKLAYYHQAFYTHLKQREKQTGTGRRNKRGKEDDNIPSPRLVSFFIRYFVISAFMGMV